MSLFGKKQPELPSNFLAEEPTIEQAGVDQNSVLDYLLQLKTEDYDKLLQLVKIYREANKKAGALIPQYDPDLVETVEVQEFGKSEPTTIATGVVEDDEDLDALVDGELAAAFIETEDKKGKK